MPCPVLHSQEMPSTKLLWSELKVFLSDLSSLHYEQNDCIAHPNASTAANIYHGCCYLVL